MVVLHLVNGGGQTKYRHDGVIYVQLFVGNFGCLTSGTFFGFVLRSVQVAIVRNMHVWHVVLMCADVPRFEHRSGHRAL